MAKKYGYYIEGDNIAILENTSETVDYHTSGWSTVKDTGLTFYIYGSKIPAKLTTDAISTEIPLPHNLDEYVLNFIIAEGYQDPRNMVPQMSQQFLAKADYYKREAKKKFRRRRTKGGFIKPVDY